LLSDTANTLPGCEIYDSNQQRMYLSVEHEMLESSFATGKLGLLKKEVGRYGCDDIISLISRR